MTVLIQNLFKLKKGDKTKFFKPAWEWHRKSRASRVGSKLKPFPEWDDVKDFEFNVLDVIHKKNQNYRNGVAIIVKIEDNTICRGLSHVIHDKGTSWVLHGDWKYGNNPYVFFRKV